MPTRKNFIILLSVSLSLASMLVAYFAYKNEISSVAQTHMVTAAVTNTAGINTNGYVIEFSVQPSLVDRKPTTNR